jgi:hypothetical protein
MSACGLAHNRYTLRLVVIELDLQAWVDVREQKQQEKEQGKESMFRIQMEEKDRGKKDKRVGLVSRST